MTSRKPQFRIESRSLWDTEAESGNLKDAIGFALSMSDIMRVSFRIVENETDEVIWESDDG